MEASPTLRCWLQTREASPAALAVAVYVTKVPIPFLNKGSSRSAEQDAAETRKNQNWDPNAPLYGKNAARTAAQAATPPRLPA